MGFRRFKNFSRGAVRKKGIRKSGIVGNAPRSRKRKGSALSSLAKRVKRLDCTIETKSGTRTIGGGDQYLHNTLYVVNSTFLQTTNGTMDIENNTGQRIGDKISLVGVKFTLMFELNERYSECTFRLMVIRSAKGDTPNIGTLWQGASANKMLDTFNTERFTVLHSKYVKLTAPNMGIDPALIQVLGSGFASGGEVISRATRIVKFWVPGKKFSKSGILQYENGSAQVKFFDYHFLIYAYSNFNFNCFYYWKQ